MLAVVNGQEVTAQDVAAEQRASPAEGRQSPPLVLQHVVARVLLAQGAHAQKLDRYPGFPSDMARIQQSILAQKLLQTTVKPAVKPTPADVDRFIADHPYAFRNRMRVNVDEIRFQSSDNMKSVQGADSLPAVLSRLKTLGMQVDHQSRTADTAQLPTFFAQKLATTPIGELFYLRDRNNVLGIVITGREPVTVAPEQLQAEAAQLMTQLATQQQVEAEVNRLRTQAKIAYQSGYAPPPPPKPPAAS